MSYTSSDPEYLHREPDSSSIASSSTTASQASKTKKKPWSKFKSSIKSIGSKMSGKPKFTEPTESSEQKRVKKNKKSKGNNAGETMPSTSEESPREKSPTKGPTKSIIKKLSVESISTPYVGLQPSTVTPAKSYAKALHKSGSTSESNLSASDIDSPKKYLTLDKNTKYSVDSQGSPDSGRLSQHMESSGSQGSRPPSQITEEGYDSGTQREVASDVSVDSDSTPQRPGRRASTEAPFYNLVAKTEQFAKTVRVPTPEKDSDVSVAFIKAEATKGPVTPDPVVSSASTVTEPIKKSEVKEKPSEDSSKNKEPPKTTEPPKPEVTSVSGESEGRKKKKESHPAGDKADDSKTADFIKTEQISSEGVVVKTEKDTGAKSNVDSETTKKETSESKNKHDHPKKLDEKEKQPTSEITKIEEPSTPAEKKTPKEDKPDKKDAAKSDPVPKQSGAEISKSSSSKPEDPLAEGKGDEASGKSKSEDKTVSSKKTPPQSLNLPSPLSDASTSSPAGLDTEMSVEEKLEAFLSAEGWPGPAKEVAVKVGARGSQQLDKRECLYKILVIGELGTGKTSIIKRYVHQFFSQHYRATIGVDFALKVINWDPNTIIRLQLWDIAGQERFGNMTRVYYKEAVGAFIVFDVTRSATFDAVLKWKQDLDSKVQLADGSSIPCVLLANKCDQQKEGIVNTPAKMDEYCKENNFSAWFETSAKENINIDDAAKSLVSQILQNDKMSQNGRDSSRDGSKFPLEGKSDEGGRSCAC